MLVKVNSQIMKCPYSNTDCDVNTSGMTKDPCQECEHYDRGVRATGATPNLAALLKLIDKIYFYITKKSYKFTEL